MSDSRGEGGFKMTPKNWTLEGKNWTWGGRGEVKNDPKKSDIILGRSLTFVDENLPNLTREEHLYETPTKTNVI